MSWQLLVSKLGAEVLSRRLGQSCQQHSLVVPAHSGWGEKQQPARSCKGEEARREIIATRQDSGKG